MSAANCTVEITRLEATLDAGQRIAGQDLPDCLYDGPAFISGPTRSWQQAAALEGALDANLHVHSAVGLLEAHEVRVDRHALAGVYTVLSASVSGNGWRFDLKRRPTDAN